MILEFSVENYLTFEKKVTINFCQNNKLTKHALLLGANASGKSSIKKALFECVSLISKKTIEKNEHTRHMFSDKTHTISKYEILLCSEEGTYFWYFLECDYIHGIITKEILLYSISQVKDSFKPIFSRDEKGDIIFDEDASNGKWNLDSAVKANIAPNTNKTILNVLLDSHLKDRPYLQQLKSIIVNIKLATIGKLEFSEYDIDLYQKFAQMADTSFTGFAPGFFEKIHRLIIHKENVQIPLGNEATGTLRMLELAPFIADTIKKGGFLCIDEFEYALHPMLVQSIVEIFANKDFNTKKAQILLIGHSGTLMRDEKLNNYDIWICQKDLEHRTQIYNLGDYYNDYETKQANVETRFNNYLDGKLFGSPAPKYTLDTIKILLQKGE